SRQPHTLDKTNAADDTPALAAYVPVEPGKELAFLANTIMAGCSIQARPFTPKEAVDAVVAICKLGHDRRPADSPAGRSLVSAFQIGWKVLYDEVSLYAAERHIDILKFLRCEDRQTQAQLNALRKEMRKHW